MNQSHLQNSGEIIFTVVVAAFVFVMLVGFIVVFILFYQRKRSAHMQEITAVKTKFHETLLQAKLEVKEQALQHIAYELHDNLGQVASLIKIHLNTLQFEGDATAKQKIEDTKDLVRLLITDLKSLSISLNSDHVVQHGIVAALENEVRRLNKIGQFEITLEKQNTVPILDTNTAIILYRMVQEILNNSIKHSNAKRVNIVLRAIENLFTLVYKDDGVGFEMEEKIKSGGSGLTTLQNRSKSINATLTIQSAPETGTIISIELPSYATGQPH
jgi:two-component system NarL family sensor kinase